MIAPIEIENKEFKKGIMGYKEEEVDEFLDLVKEDYEQLYRENADLKEKVRLYQEQKDDYEELQRRLNDTLLLAQGAAEDIKNAANNKSKSIVEKAESDASRIIDQAHNEVIEIKREYHSLVKEFKVFRNKFKSLLNDQLTNIDQIFSNIDEEYSNTMLYDLQDEVATSSID